jgi:type II secretory pathway pseudopilin PulG
MNPPKLRRSRSHRQRGYALLLAMFLTTMLLIATLVAAPSVRTERKREKEEEMIWRGKQYVHAIKLYYRKNGRLPTSVDDLTKPKNGSVRYLRQEYKDPMNKDDGTWRFIYVGPAGQLIGSLKPPQTINMQSGNTPQVGTPAANLNGPLSMQGAQSSNGGFGGGFGQSGNATASGSAAPANAGTAGAPGAPGTGGTTPGAPGSNQPGQPGQPDDANSSLNPAPVAAPETSSIIGGNIIGIGSKVNKQSVIVYEKAKNYRLFEFVWDPSKDTMAVGGQPGSQIGTPNGIGGVGQQPTQGSGTQGFGGNSSFGGNQGFGTQPGSSSQPSGNSPMQPPSMPPTSTNPPPTNQ